MLAWWRDFAAPQDVLVAHGGSQQDFQDVAHSQKFFVDDPRLRTRDHQREFQSYSGIFRLASEWMRGREIDVVHFCEYDQVPLARDFNQLQAARLDAEDADVLGYRVLRVDGTSHPHFLQHAANPRFLEYWKTVTRRPDAGVVLSMFGTGSVWRRKVFDAVASLEEPFPMYMELFLPTLAHHLGHRVRPLRDQDRFVENLGDFGGSIEDARSAGAWVVHPVKRIWFP
jgi:hypothetical protein